LKIKIRAETNIDFDTQTVIYRLLLQSTIMSDEAAATIAPTEGRGKRERKQTAYLAPEAEPVKAAFVAKGSGTELGDIPYCEICQ
jgi:hypothetical protein